MTCWVGNGSLTWVEVDATCVDALWEGVLRAAMVMPAKMTMSRARTNNAILPMIWFRMGIQLLFFTSVPFHGWTTGTHYELGWILRCAICRIYSWCVRAMGLRVN